MNYKKKITQIRPFSNNVEQVIYADGSIGYRQSGGFAGESQAIFAPPNEPQKAMEWDSGQDVPASNDEIMKMLQDESIMQNKPVNKG